MQGDQQKFRDLYLEADASNPVTEMVHLVERMADTRLEFLESTRIRNLERLVLSLAMALAHVENNLHRPLLAVEDRASRGYFRTKDDEEQGTRPNFAECVLVGDLSREMEQVRSVNALIMRAWPGKDGGLPLTRPGDLR